MGTRLLILALSFAVAWSPVAPAMEVHLTRALQFQMVNENALETVGLLRAGSRVEIPDRYRVKNAQGAFDEELTLNNWLQTAGRTGYAEKDKEGGLVAKTQTSLDYFYPIKIVSAAPGSTLSTYQGRTYFLALRMLTRQSGQLSTTADSHPEPESRRETRRESQEDSNSEAIGSCPNGACRSRTRVADFDELIAALEPVLQRADTRAASAKHRTAIDLREIATSFRQNCGFTLESFLPIVKDQAAKAKVPPEILLAIMVQESSGRCYSGSSNGDGSHDAGLFGVNSHTSKIRRCEPQEIRWLRSAGPSSLASGPRCIENPVVNLQASLTILNGKIDAITPPFDEAKLRDTKGRLTPDAWRMVASAYNGGETWVIRAKSDLEAFNHVHGTHLNPYNWEDLRIFYLRDYLNSEQKSEYLGHVRSTRPRHDSALMNLAYAENVVPRSTSARASDSPSAADLWRTRLALARGE